jgi:hypothetical protein
MTISFQEAFKRLPDIDHLWNSWLCGQFLELLELLFLKIESTFDQSLHVPHLPAFIKRSNFPMEKTQRKTYFL